MVDQPQRDHGCITQAMKYQDLKQPNILLRPHQIFLADFGISRDRRKEGRSTIEYHVRFSCGYAAPQVVSEGKRNAKEDDIYSLGCVFLHILTAVYDGPQRKFHNYPDRGPDQNVHPYTSSSLCGIFATSSNIRSWRSRKTGSTLLFNPLLWLVFLRPIFNSDRKMRPTILQVDQARRSLGKEDCVKYGRCCTYSNSIGQIANAENQDFTPRAALPLKQGKVRAS